MAKKETQEERAARLKAERTKSQSVPVLIVPLEWIDASLANLPLLRQADEIYTLPTEVQIARGYYSPEVRELIANMNRLRSNFFLGLGTAPNFGPKAAYNNPAAELDASRTAALSFPNAFLTGVTMSGGPSATRAAVEGTKAIALAAKAGLLTVGNVATKVGNAVTQGTKAAGKAVTQTAKVAANPRTITTSALIGNSVAADASNEGKGGSDSKLISYGIPAILIAGGAGILGHKWWAGRKALKPAEDAIQEATTLPTKVLLGWKSWWEFPMLDFKQLPKKNAAIERKGMVEKWNKAVQEGKTAEFMQSTNARFSNEIPYPGTNVTEPNPETVKAMNEVIEGNMPALLRSKDGTLVKTLSDNNDYTLLIDLPNNASKLAYTPPTASLRHWAWIRNGLRGLGYGVGAIGLGYGISTGINALSGKPLQEDTKLGDTKLGESKKEEPKKENTPNLQTPALKKDSTAYVTTRIIKLPDGRLALVQDNDTVPWLTVDKTNLGANQFNTNGNSKNK